MKVELQKKQVKILAFAPYLSAGFAFLIGAIILSFSGVDPIVAYGVMIKGAFGSIRTISDTLVKTTSLLLAGLAVALAFKCRIWNIGAEGQLYMGALGAALAGISVIGTVPILGVSIALIAGFIFGASIGLVPAVLKVKLGVNEIIVTVLLNFVLLLFITYLLHGPIKAPGFNPYSPEIFPQSQLPIILSHTRLHAGIIVAALVTIAMYLLLSKSILVVMAISGGIAGLAGAVLVTGVQHYLIEGISPGYGFIAVIVALLGRQHPIGVAIVAFFFAALISGSEVMYRTLGIPSSFAPTLQALVLIFVLVGELFTRLPAIKRRSVI